MYHNATIKPSARTICIDSLTRPRHRARRLARALRAIGALSALAWVGGCASSSPQWAPPTSEQPHAKLNAQFLNVRHEPDAAWGKSGFRPRLEICEGRKPGCGKIWCYDCENNGAARQWKISGTSVGAELLLPTVEQTITAFTYEKSGECKADPLTIAPKKGLTYDLIYSHVWSGPDASSYRCAATLERQGETPPPDTAPAGEPEAPAEPGGPEEPAAKPAAGP